MIEAPPGIYSSRQIVPKREFLRTEFYNDWGLRHEKAFCMQALAFKEARRCGHPGCVPVPSGRRVRCRARKAA